MKTYQNNIENIPVINVFDDTTPSIILATGYGSIFPASNGRITVELRNSAGQAIKREIIDYTARSGDTITGLTRSVEPCVQDDTAVPKTRTQNTLDFTPASGQIVTVSLRFTEEFVSDVEELVETTHNTLRDSLDNNSVIYVNNTGEEVELPLGSNGQFLKSNGPTVAPSFESPTVDINGLTLDNDPLDNDDMLVYFDGLANKKRNAKASTTQEGLSKFMSEATLRQGKSQEESVNLAFLAKYLFPVAGVGTTTQVVSIPGSFTVTTGVQRICGADVYVGGRYTYQFTYTGDTVGQQFLQIRLNGSTVASTLLSCSGVGPTLHTISMNIDCISGDDIEIWTSGGGNLTGSISSVTLRCTPIARTDHSRTSGYFTGTVI